MKLSWSDVTPEALVLNRRGLLAGMAAVAATPAFARGDAPTAYEDITGYNNYVELGMGKSAPAENAHRLTMSPWSVEIGGLVERPGTLTLDEIAPVAAREERIYRFRCVEAWSMVVPWEGVPLAGVLDRAGVKPEARFVAFETVYRPDELPGQRRKTLDWPYREALRLDEARHPLSFLATGIYRKPLPAQSGGPIRLVVPWKYGFKSIKSIVRITLTDRQPETTWNALQPDEYGFYANVNPKVDHPRWSQRTERRIGAGLLAGRDETRLFNGYDEVAPLYAGMDLARDY